MSILTQEEADYLTGLEKKCVDDKKYSFNERGSNVAIPLIGVANNKETFFLDLERGTLTLRYKFQQRARRTIVLVRIDINGSPHKNPEPDNTIIPCPHMHYYVEGFDDKFAKKLPDSLSTITDASEMYNEFLKLCNVVELPNVNWELPYVAK